VNEIYGIAADTIINWGKVRHDPKSPQESLEVLNSTQSWQQIKTFEKILPNIADQQGRVKMIEDPFTANSSIEFYTPSPLFDTKTLDHLFDVNPSASDYYKSPSTNNT
jgi:hypothetical protein